MPTSDDTTRSLELDDVDAYVAHCRAHERQADAPGELGVFEGNRVALRLYRSLGFQECGRVRDSFRVEGRSIDDVRMTLWIGGRR